MAETTPVLRQFLRLPKVCAAIGKGRSWLYQALKDHRPIKEGGFPQPIKLGPATVVWDAAEIAEWQQARIAERNAANV